MQPRFFLGAGVVMCLDLTVRSTRCRMPLVGKVGRGARDGREFNIAGWLGPAFGGVRAPSAAGQVVLEPRVGHRGHWEAPGGTRNGPAWQGNLWPWEHLGSFGVVRWVWLRRDSSVGEAALWANGGVGVVAHAAVPLRPGSYLQ